ncbi:MAG TPA: glutaredoxin domain-containing protein, partial [Halanaerobiales bacterium]|nr:glutaredoxin domain-containing protein [Halanaerobiales bacterium]
MKNQDLNIEVYSKQWCPYCRKAKAFLKAKGLSFTEHNVDEKDELNEMEKRAGRKTVPQ